MQHAALIAATHTQFARSAYERWFALIAVPVLCLVSFAICGLPQHGLAPTWLVFALNFVLTIRIVSLHHELIHESPARVDWNFLVRLNLHIYTPLTVGFAELRRLHLLHHRFVNGAGDPDYPMVKGSKLRALFELAFMPEHWFVYALRHRLISRDFWPLWALRCAIWSAFVYWVGIEAYLMLYLLPSKIANAVLYIYFSFDVHTDNDGRRQGSYNFKPRWLWPGAIVGWLVGRVAYNGSYHHATHHRYPWVSGNKLHLATSYFHTREPLMQRQRAL